LRKLERQMRFSNQKVKQKYLLYKKMFHKIFKELTKKIN
jgi:hypothetical protein